MSSICCTERGKSSSVYSGQPSTSVQPFWPVSRSPGEVVPLMPPSVSRMPCMRSLWLAAAAPPDWMQIVPPSGLISWAIFARLTPMS